MIRPVERVELQALMAEGVVQVVDVLGEAEYTESHLPGAINIPLRKLNPETVSVLRRDRPVVVY